MRTRIALTAVILALALSACQPALRLPGLGLTDTAVPSLSPSPSPSPTFEPTLTPAARPTRDWSSVPTPSDPQPTAIPQPLGGLEIPPEMRLLVLAGSDQPSPLVGRTDTVLLIFYHPRLARAALVSLPPDLLVYIPGFGMQRLYTAYALGGSRALKDTIEYNFGLRPDHSVLVHMDEFTYFIDELGGLELPNLNDLPRQCGGVPPGWVHLDGQLALCYVRLREGENESSRARRQQEVFDLIFTRMVENGMLTNLPRFFQTYRGRVETDLQLKDLTAAIPLTLALGDRGRLGFFHFSDQQLTRWTLPGLAEAQVFLAKPKTVRALIQQALDFTNTAAPFTDRLPTLEAWLTRTPIPSLTFTPGPTYTPTTTPPRTRTPAITAAPTQTRTPTRSATPSPTPTPTETQESQ